MTPFDGLLFFYLLVLLLIPAVLLGLFEKPLRHYGLIATIVVLFFVFDTAEKRLLLLGFFALETALVFLYLRVRRRTEKRPVLWLFLLLSLAPLILAKVGGVMGSGFFSFLGVSYMTFRAVQVLIETYDGLITEIKPLDFTYFLLFFPSVSSGPIDRYRRFTGDLCNVPSRADYVELVKRGVFKLISGAFLNFGVSNMIYTLWLSRLAERTIANDISYMYGYTFFLFFNFAGYSLMAIGASYILGVKVPENFDMPFLSRDMKDFWARWHISLSTYMRDYVYTRFTMASMKGEWFRDRRTGSYIGYLITMVTMGLWHGLSPRYLLYGLYHGILMCLNDVLDTRWKRFKKLKKGGVSQAVLILITFHLVAAGLLLFSGRIL
ncbi:D-alanyl-lipoteichoic acid biosynthesis protein DltB [Oscillospiraceae bacterium OttesenSCG-928-G22]|nr:D-alanyl-lipoteichoic acid biosynthesis protein DltB [Oscillospiraceae bacterium OttesenSCG-928-G22]